MPKLTDTQLVILSAAVQQKDGHALPVPKSLKARGAALAKTLEALIKKGLLKEVPAALGTEAWRKDADSRPMTVVITEAGRGAINDEASQPITKSSARSKRCDKKKTRTDPRQAMLAPMPRGGTKLALLIGLLERKSGANMDELIEATGWQAHTVRAALTGIRKRGFTVMRSQGTDGSVYRAGTD